jgi:large subunit ribosomal protein L10
MNREQKTTYVNDLKTVIAANEGILVYHYEGITVKDLESLRAKMRESGAFLKITKNRIAKIALKGSKAEKLEKFFKGPTAIGSSSDPVMAAKILVDYAKENEKLVIIGGGLEDKALSKIDVEALAKLPSLNDLRGKLVGLLQAPASKILRLSVEPASQVLRTISQKSKQ